MEYICLWKQRKEGYAPKDHAGSLAHGIKMPSLPILVFSTTGKAAQKHIVLHITQAVSETLTSGLAKPLLLGP